MIHANQFFGLYFVDESIGLDGSFKSRGVAQQIRSYGRNEAVFPVE